MGTPARGVEHRPRGRTPSRADGLLRSFALLLLAVALGLPVLLTSGLASDTPGLAGTPPYRIPSGLGTTKWGVRWDPAQDLGGSAALLYVSDGCPHCRAELRSWASLGEPEGTVRLWIVASPESEVDSLSWVPPTLRGRVVWDHEGAIAKALGVQAVPATLWVDSTGVVRDQWLGRTTPVRLHEGLRRLTGSTAPNPRPLLPTGDPP